MPTNSRSEAKLTLQELMADHHVVHHIVVMSAGFIMHRPPSVDEIKATLLDQVSDRVLHFLGLAIPPHGEELHLDLSESLVRILEKLIDSSGNDHVDLSSLDLLRRASEILVHRLQPAYIVVRVRAYMDVKMIG